MNIKSKVIFGLLLGVILIHDMAIASLLSWSTVPNPAHTILDYLGFLDLAFLLVAAVFIFEGKS